MAAFPGGNGLIAFAGRVGPPAPGEPSGVRHIFTIRPDGSGVRQLTNDATFDYAPSWSADGRRLVFSRESLEGTPGVPPTGLFTINADGGDPTLVVDVQREDFFPVPAGFSPSGDRIIYTTLHSIRTIRPDGTDPRQVLSGVFFSRAQYSPSGRRILVDGAPAGKERAGIWTVRRDGTDPRRLINPRARTEFCGGEFSDDSPDYSPDGRHIVFRRYSFRGGCGEQIRVVRADGTDERLIADTVNAGAPVYAPAGDRIALSIADAPAHIAQCADLYTISATGSDIQNVTNACRPSPDFSRPISDVLS
ncbi:MAG: TolB family protein [Solirubrobacterales bacterium]